MTPFVADLTERASKTLAGGVLAYLFQTWVSTLHSIDAFERGCVWAAGTTLCSIGFSLGSRWVGRRGTASMTRAVEYDAET
jgi:hypothetical protein